jgi:hypothetical protein
MRGLWPRRVFSNGVILNVPMQQVLYQGTTSVSIISFTQREGRLIRSMDVDQVDSRGE